MENGEQVFPPLLALALIQFWGNLERKDWGGWLPGCQAARLGAPNSIPAPIGKKSCSGPFGYYLITHIAQPPSPRPGGLQGKVEPLTLSTPPPLFLFDLLEAEGFPTMMLLVSTGGGSRAKASRKYVYVAI